MTPIQNIVKITERFYGFPYGITPSGRRLRVSEIQLRVPLEIGVFVYGTHWSPDGAQSVDDGTSEYFLAGGVLDNVTINADGTWSITK